MIKEIFDYSINNSKFEPFSKTGTEKNVLKLGYKNSYYRMCISDESFKVGYLQYQNGKTFLTFGSSKKNILTQLLSQLTPFQH